MNVVVGHGASKTCAALSGNLLVERWRSDSALTAAVSAPKTVPAMGRRFAVRTVLAMNVLCPSKTTAPWFGYAEPGAFPMEMLAVAGCTAAAVSANHIAP